MEAQHALNHVSLRRTKNQKRGTGGGEPMIVRLLQRFSFDLVLLNIRPYGVIRPDGVSPEICPLLKKKTKPE